MEYQLLTGHELDVLIGLGLSLVCGFLIGYERELRGKPAGISTNSFVIAGAMLFTTLSIAADPNSPARIAAQVVSGIGFLGAGMILKEEIAGKVTNLTTAASIWFSAAVGMALGFGWYLIAIAAAVFGAIVPRLPTARRQKRDNNGT
ncbi:MAG TPA: MgtC/SapB family protein [Kofleriaceae bacterium]|jgi:putative Mg2+ transporter-C (MgtC) family protein|nr:MgtC/SapB family protein [Kofleriaceae bacterium]